MMAHRIFACGHPMTGLDACPICGSTDLVERCDCGSGAHPRECALHPGAYEEHCRELERDS